MKTKVFFLLFLAVAISCKKENDEIENLLPKYQSICDVWKPLTISYDSMDVRVTKPIQYDRLKINSNLSYEILLDATVSYTEDGTITIISQTDDKLEIYFDAVYPSYSSFAGSHIFGFSNVILETLNNDELIFKSIDNSYFQNVVFRFRKY